MPYIQRGGGIFSTIGDVVKRFALPFFVRAAKTAGSGAVKAIKSNAAKSIVREAKNAVADGLIDTTGKILQGHNVGQAIKEGSNQAKNRVTKVAKREANKIGTNLRKRKTLGLNEKDIPNTKRSKKTSKKAYKSNPVL